ncbi:hypothetical protein GGR50DRAFT_208878 [Xylaria sp. CBS 124048]|nr:hypothetical protein GGR50DRAFT_208878 [Xylaria sp. CBS 124048]
MPAVRVLGNKEGIEALQAWLSEGKGFPNPHRASCTCGEYSIRWEHATIDCPHTTCKMTWRCGNGTTRKTKSGKNWLCTGAKRATFHTVPTGDDGIVMAGNCLFCFAKILNEWKRERDVRLAREDVPNEESVANPEAQDNEQALVEEQPPLSAEFTMDQLKLGIYEELNAHQREAVGESRAAEQLRLFAESKENQARKKAQSN